MMRKTVRIWLVILLVIAGFGYYLYITMPRKIDLDAQGIKYRLGQANQGSEKSVNVQIQGWLYRSLSGDRTFKGTIEIEGEELPPPGFSKGLSINFEENPYGWVRYVNVDGGGIRRYHYGTIYVADDFSKVTFTINEPGGGWSEKDGIMLSAPATSREDALRISNDLMGEFIP